MKMHRLLFVLVLFCATTSLAQTETESLLIGPGDELRVEVFDTPEMAQTVRVTDAGEIPLLLVGNVKVEGLTPGKAARVIEEVLRSKQFMIHPQVSVSMEEFATQQVSIMGQVHSPGTYSITAPISVINMLSEAGGLTDAADRNITIERHGHSQDIVKYFFSNDSDAALKNSVVVYPGDTVIVPKTGVVYVLGDVARPGGYTMSDNESHLTVLEAVANAGGANKTAIVSNIKLVRKSETGITEMPVAFRAMEQGKQPDLAMQPDDVLFIPFSYMKNLAVNGSQIIASAGSALIYTHP
jgi:polysaccharide export outer membrane protein